MAEPPSWPVWQRSEQRTGRGRHKLSDGAGVYDKGPLMLHALRRQIGQAAFDKVLKRWPAQYSGKIPAWAEMEKLVQQVSGQNLKGFFDAWIRSGQMPEDTYLWPGSLRPGATAPARN